MKAVRKVVSLVTLCLGVAAVGQAQQGSRGVGIAPRPMEVMGRVEPVVNLNGQWDFQIGSGRTGKIVVPSEWEMQGYRVQPGEKAKYSRSFDVPAAWDGQRIIIKFDAVSSYAEVFVNGQRIGSHEGGFVAFEMDVTEAAKVGKNDLRVEVQANTISDILSCVSQYAAHTVGGLLRKVTVFTLPSVHVADLNVETDFDAQFVQATLRLDAQIANRSGQQESAALRYTLLDHQGNKVVSKTTAKQQVATGGVTAIHVDIPSGKVKPWTAESPYLYELVTELIANGKTLQKNKQRIGFREVAIRGNELLVNGKPVKLKGVNRHAVHPLLGRASDPQLDRKDAALYLSGNLNYIRTSHYPPSEEFLEAADELGLYVESESALNWIMHHASPIWRHWDYKDPRFLPTMLQANIDNVWTNKKHPSVIFWSLGNESRWSELWATVNKTVKELDKTRPTSFHDQTWGGFNNAGSQADIANYHYPGINGPAATDTMKRPTLFGEYAHLSTYNRRELLTDPGVRDAFNAPMVTFFDSIYQHKGNLGGAIWSGIDDTFHLPDGRIVGYGPWGPVDGWRREKPEFYGIKKAYAPVRIKAPVETAQGIELSIENRYDFRSLKDVEFEVTVDDKRVPLQVAIAARSTGKVLLPGIKNYRSLQVRVIDSRGFEIERERFERTESKRVAQKATALALVEDSAFIYVTQGEVAYTISKTYGTVTATKNDGTAIWTKGPSVAIVATNSEDGGKPNVAGETYQNNIYPIKHYPLYTLFANAVKARTFADSMVIDMDLTYQQGQGTQQFVFTKTGQVTVRYAMTYEQQEMAVYQYGLLSELPLTFDALSWERKGAFTDYPENHIGRNKGTARLNAVDLVDVEAFGVPKSSDWKDDANGLGSNDFRSTKSHILSVSLQNQTGAKVVVLSNSKQASRTWKQDARIQWLVADYTNNGSEPFYGTPHSYGRLKLKKGDTIKGQATFSF